MLTSICIPMTFYKNLNRYQIRRMVKFNNHVMSYPLACLFSLYGVRGSLAFDLNLASITQRFCHVALEKERKTKRKESERERAKEVL